MDMKTEFIGEMVHAVELSKRSREKVYLYLSDDLFRFTHEYTEDYLFLAWPGGRKVLSKGGRELAEQLGVDPMEWS